VFPAKTMARGAGPPRRFNQARKFGNNKWGGGGNGNWGGRRGCRGGKKGKGQGANPFGKGATAKWLSHLGRFASSFFESLFSRCH